MRKPVSQRRYCSAAHRRLTVPSSSHRGRTVPHSPPHSLHTPAASVTTFYRVLCPHSHLDAVTAKIPTILADTGAAIDLLPPSPGDSDRVIQTSDRLLLTPLGRFPHHSPARHALLLLTDLLADARAREVRTNPKRGLWAIIKLLVPKPNMGYLLGTGEATMRHLRKESNARIRVWRKGPRCLSASEELVQVKGEWSCVKKAVERITDILKESLQHDYLDGHLHLPHQFFPPAHEFMAGLQRRSPSPAKVHPSCEPIVFRIICRDDKIGSIMDRSEDGVGRLLREEVGVDVRVGEPVPSLDGHVVVITSHEGPAQELFPAQEALLHIQSICSNLGDKDNINTTEVLVPSGWNGCLEGRNLSKIRKSSGTNVRILPKQFLPAGLSEKDELVQIVGGITEARNALLQLTEKLRCPVYQDVKYLSM